MSKIAIPAAALEAGRETVNNARLLNLTSYEIARACFQAMAKVWPGMQTVSEFYTRDGDYFEPSLILPLTEKPDD